MQETAKLKDVSEGAGEQQRLSSSFFAPETEEQGADIGDYLAQLLQYKWLILLIAGLGYAVGYLNYFLEKPRYQATSIFQIERKSSGYTGSFLGALSEFQPIFSVNLSTPAEIILMESRSVMRAVSERLNLDVRALPIYYPYVGEAIARQYKGGGVAKPWFDQAEYAWGGERIDVGSLNLPEEFRGTGFLLVAELDGRYSLFHGNEKVLEGKVGKRAEGLLNDEDRLAIFVSYLKARPGTRFQVTKLRERSVIKGLKAAFSAEENPRSSGIMRAKVVGDDPQRITKIVNEVVETYQRENLSKKSAEAENVLEYLEKQLPKLKERLSAAEDAYNTYRLEHGSLDIKSETQQVLQGIVDNEQKLFAIEQKKEELNLRYTLSYPHHEARSLDKQSSALREKLAALEEQMLTLPETEQTVLGLARDVEVNSRLYSELINSTQKLRIARAGTVGNVQIIEEALLPLRSFAPNKQKTLVTYTGIGFVLGLGLAFLLLKLRSELETAEEIERGMGMPVYGSIPHSDLQVKMAKRQKRRPKDGAFVLASEKSDDPVTESFRSLRAGLHFLLLECKNNVVLITGPREGVGKSFVALNMATVLAQSNKKVLLIDADMRRGHLNSFLGISKERGLSEYVSGEIDLDEAIKQTSVDGVHFIPTGKRPPNPAELLMADSFSRLLKVGAQGYDYVIVDAPPVLAVSDAGIIGLIAGTTLLVVRAGLHHVTELELTVKRLRQSGANVKGFVLNDVRIYRSYGYGYGYGYRYSYKMSADK